MLQRAITVSWNCSSTTQQKSLCSALSLYLTPFSSQSKTTSWKSGGCHLQFYEDPRTWDGQIIKCGLFSPHPLQPPTTTFLFPGQNRYKRLQIILLLSCCSSSSIRAVINKQNCDSVAKVLLLVVFFSFFSYYGGGWDVVAVYYHGVKQCVRPAYCWSLFYFLLPSYATNGFFTWLCINVESFPN